MKIRSTHLYTYLFETGALNGTPEEIDSAKRNYRRLYKKRWKRQTGKRKEIRFTVTNSEYEIIQKRVRASTMKTAGYIRKVIISASLTSRDHVKRDDILNVLQLISMAYTICIKESSLMRVCELIGTAEEQLLLLQKKLI